LSGTVAVGAPITDGTLRIVDAAGAVVAADVPIDANGRYAGVTLSGTGPWRIEACGHAGDKYQCVYAVATTAGTANVTPLTSAAALLASGQTPEALMSASTGALTNSSLEDAQSQLRASLASVLAQAGVDARLDFVTGPLTAGSRSGYDGVLDAVSVSTGEDDKPFVQITPRLGSGNLYIEPGHTTGAINANTGAEGLDLAGLATLFSQMSAALASPAACASADTGIRRALAGGVRMSMGGDAVQGAEAVAQAMCQFFAGGEDGQTPMWGATLMSPTLGRCDLSGSAPVCGITFAIRSPAGDIQRVGNGMGVTRESGAWRFLGDLRPLELYASAKVQRTKRVDGATPVFDYDRALAFEVAVTPGLACAKVSQRNAAGDEVTLAYYKRHPGASTQRRLALWTADGMSQTPSLNPLSGATRSADDTWVPLPQGTEGDTAIRNFYRGGRSVFVSLYADDSCGTTFTLAGRSRFEVEVEGVPPVWAVMEHLPWPEIDAASVSALRALALDAGASGTLHAGWSFTRGPLGVNGITVCGSRADCGQDGSGRLGERTLRPDAREATVSLLNRGPAVGAADAKTLAIYGRNGEGLDLQTNYSSCPSVAAGESCH
jgi:hypothetical protein